jgi:hypothetical protein
MKAKTLDPELENELNAAGERPVEAVFFLKSPKGRSLDREQTRQIVQKIVDRAESKTSRKADAISVFESLQSFALKGPAPVIKELANAKEVHSARVSRTSQDLLIRPVSKRRVTLPKR